MFEYRQVLVRMRQGDSDRDMARLGLMGRKKLTAVRRVAQDLGWLDPAQPLPGDTVIAGQLGRTPHLPSTCVSTLESFHEQITGWFQADVQGMTNHSALKRNRGYTGSYSTVRRFLQQLSVKRDLATGRYIDKKVAILIAGPTGTGKPHLAQALGHCAARQGRDVVFVTQTKLLSGLQVARAMGTSTALAAG